MEHNTVTIYLALLSAVFCALSHANQILPESSWKSSKGESLNVLISVKKQNKMFKKEGGASDQEWSKVWTILAFSRHSVSWSKA